MLFYRNLILLFLCQWYGASRDHHYQCETVPYKYNFNAIHVKGKIVTSSSSNHPPFQTLSNTTLEMCNQQCKLNLSCQLSEFIPDKVSLIWGRCQFYHDATTIRYVTAMYSNFIMVLSNCSAPMSNKSQHFDGYWLKFVNFRPDLRHLLLTNITIEESENDGDYLSTCTASRYCGHLLEQRIKHARHYFYSYWTNITESWLVYSEGFTFYKWIFLPLSATGYSVKQFQCNTSWSNISVSVMGRIDAHPDDNRKYSAFFQTMNITACFTECSYLNCGRVFFNLTEGLCLLESQDQREDTCGDKYNLPAGVTFHEFNVTTCDKVDTSVPSSACVSHKTSRDILSTECIVIKQPDNVSLRRNECNRMMTRYNFTRMDLPFRTFHHTLVFGDTYLLHTKNDRIWVKAESAEALCPCNSDYCDYFENDDLGEYVKYWGQYQMDRFSDINNSNINNPFAKLLGAIKPSCSCYTVDHCAHVAREGQWEAMITKDLKFYPNFIIGKSGIVLEGMALSEPSLHDEHQHSYIYVAVVGNYTRQYPSKSCIASVLNITSQKWNVISSSISDEENKDNIDLVSHRFPDMMSRDERFDDFFVLTNNYMREHSLGDPHNWVCDFTVYFVSSFVSLLLSVAVGCLELSLCHRKGCRHVRLMGLRVKGKYRFNIIPLMNCESIASSSLLDVIDISILSPNHSMQLSQCKLFFLADYHFMNHEYLFKLVNNLVDYLSSDINLCQRAAESTMIKLTDKLQPFSGLLSDKVSNFILLLEPKMRLKNSKPIVIICFLPKIDFQKNLMRLLLCLMKERCLCSYVLKPIQELSIGKQRHLLESISVAAYRSEEQMSMVKETHFYEKYCRLMDKEDDEVLNWQNI